MTAIQVRWFLGLRVRVSCFHGRHTLPGYPRKNRHLASKPDDWPKRRPTQPYGQAKRPAFLTSKTAFPVASKTHDRPFRRCVQSNYKGSRGMIRAMRARPSSMVCGVGILGSSRPRAVVSICTRHVSNLTHWFDTHTSDVCRVLRMCVSCFAPCQGRWQRGLRPVRRVGQCVICFAPMAMSHERVCSGPDAASPMVAWFPAHDAVGLHASPDWARYVLDGIG